MTFAQKLACSLALLALSAGTPTARAAYSLALASGFPPPDGPHGEAVAIGDVNGDGRNDVVLTVAYEAQTQTQYQAYVYFQTPDGSLAQPQKYGYHIGAGASGLALADLNHDGRMEIIVGHQTGISILQWHPLSIKMPMRATHVYSSWLTDAHDVVVVDVDRDGALDVVGKGSHTSNATVFFGDGRGGVMRQARMLTLGSGPNDLEAGDFNGDGFVDVAIVAASNSFPVYVYHNDGSDDFAAPVVADPSPGYDENSRALGRGDFNTDGRDDLIASRDDSTLSLFLQNDAGVLQAPIFVQTAWPNALVGHDLDLDGREDLVVLQGAGWLGIRLQEATGTFADEDVVGPAPYATWYNTQGLAAGDINGDSCTDVVTANPSHGLVVYLGNGCNAIADLSASLGLTSSVVSLRLDNFGEAVATDPEATLVLSMLGGTISLGTLPAGCSLEGQTAQAARVTCVGASLAANTSRTLLFPIDIAADSRRSVLSAAAAATTTSRELRLDNNSTNRQLRFLPVVP